ncbi:MAG: hypothetical protein RQ875_08115 [Vicingaceae bacterium]|nr:hypothetical protein [Vicingaceae bacterium]
MTLNLSNIFNRLFLLTLLWLLLEGVFRKWLTPQLATPLFFVKYFFAFLLYLVYFLQHQSIQKIKRIDQLFIGLYIIWCVFSVFNTRLPSSFIVPVVGLVLHLGFIPISTLTSSFISSEKKFDLFIKVLAYISIPLCILGFNQYYLPSSHILNTFVNETQLASTLGDFTRITAVFSFVKIYNVYLVFSITLLTTYIYVKLLRGEKILFYAIVVVMLIINSFMTASRLPITMSFMNITIISFYIFYNFNVIRKTVVFVLIASLISFIFLYGNTSLMNDSVDMFIKRSTHVEKRQEGQNISNVEIRLYDRLDIFKFSDISGIAGYGIGTTYQGNTQFLKKKIPVYHEEEGERLVLELGVIGGIIIVLMRLFIFIYAFYSFLNSKNLSYKLFLLSLSLLLLPPILAINNTTFNYLDNFSYWFVFGLVIAINKITIKT